MLGAEGEWRFVAQSPVDRVRVLVEDEGVVVHRHGGLRRPVRTGASDDSLVAWMSEPSAASREPLVGVGLKMFLGYAESLRYLTAVAGAAPGFSGVGVFVLPSFPVIPQAAAALGGSRVAYG